MDTITRAGVVIWLLKNNIKMVHVWPMGDPTYYCCMLESAPKGRKQAIPDKVASGTGETPLGAVRAALGNYGGDCLKFRLFMLAFMVEHIAQRSVPAYLRSIESGRT